MTSVEIKRIWFDVENLAWPYYILEIYEKNRKVGEHLCHGALLFCLNAECSNMAVV